jgi:hypothetical protein
MDQTTDVGESRGHTLIQAVDESDPLPLDHLRVLAGLAHFQ